MVEKGEERYEMRVGRERKRMFVMLLSLADTVRLIHD